MKNYESPNLSVMVITKDDILLESDAFASEDLSVNVSELWKDGTSEA